MLKLNGHPVAVTRFPDKTSQVWQLEDHSIQASNEIVWEFEGEDEVMHLVQLQQLLLSLGHTSRLMMPFLPYARQDKPISNESSFALRSFLTIVGSLGFTEVSAFDPHNPRFVSELLPNFVALSPVSEINAAIEDCRPDVLCYPDAGARARYDGFTDHTCVFATKVRDQGTGVITALRLSGEVAGKTVLIVDDICDGGMTFIKLAEALVGAKAVHLYVSHGLFSKGTDVLRNAGIQRIFTKNGEVS